VKWRLYWSAAGSRPAREAVLRSQGLPEGGSLPARIGALVDEALERYVELAEPRGLVRLVDPGEFALIYGGESRNASDTPLAHIFPKADALALFVCTLGARLTAAIADLFAGNHPARAHMLDAVASEAADGLATAAAADLRSRLLESGALGREARVLPYSPGYCGWHVTGQRALFASLGPEQIGVTLNASCLMQPLKSVSGVLVAGAAEIHEFYPAYPCCEECDTRQCEDRMASLREDGTG
jgi:hypothetical protein